MTSIIHAIEKLSDYMAKISAVILGLMTLLILVEICIWNTMEKTTLIADEYCAYGLAAIIFMGGGYCLKEKGHIRITLVLNLLPKQISSFITVVATTITTFFFGYLWWYLFQMVQSTFTYQSTSGTLTNTPLWIPQAMMLFGATMFLIQLFGMTLKACLAIFSGEDVV